MGKISTAGVLRLRATSAVSPDKSVRRSAQDDDFVGVSTKNILNKLALMGLSPGPELLWSNPEPPAQLDQGSSVYFFWAKPETSQPPSGMQSATVQFP
jgi:hypothetical protein